MIDTPEGRVVHTGDFKFDLTPVDRDKADIHRMAEIGREGVLLLLSESTNAERPGHTPSEQLVEEHLLTAFIQAKQKVIVSTFASNVSRIQQIVQVSQRTNRKLVLLGRTMVNVVEVAIKLGYLTVPEGMIIDRDEMNDFPPEKLRFFAQESRRNNGSAQSFINWEFSWCRSISWRYCYFCGRPHSWQ